MSNYIISEAEQGSEEWLKARAGKVTGTRLQRVMSTRKGVKEELALELLAENLAPLPEVYQSGWMERGHRMEEIVKKIYGETIEDVGFIARTDIDWIGISPDWIIRDEDGKITRAVEVKSPSPKIFVKYFLSDSIPDEYFWQVVHYFVVLDELEELDFIIYNPDFFSEEIRVKTIKITREELAEKIEFAKCQLAEFFAKYQEMALKFLEKSKKL